MQQPPFQPEPINSSIPEWISSAASRLFRDSRNVLRGKGPPRITQPSPCPAQTPNNPSLCIPGSSVQTDSRNSPNRTDPVIYSIELTCIFYSLSLFFPFSRCLSVTWKFGNFSLKASNLGFSLALMGVWSEISHWTVPCGRSTLRSWSEV